MSHAQPEPLSQKKCLPCEGGVETLLPEAAEKLLTRIPGWTISRAGKRIRREFTMHDFPAAIDFFQKIAALAEAEGHHPDLHLERYREVVIEIGTHAINGLSENDFILASKIDQLPCRLRQK